MWNYSVIKYFKDNQLWKQSKLRDGIVAYSIDPTAAGSDSESLSVQTKPVTHPNAILYRPIDDLQAWLSSVDFSLKILKLHNF